MKKCSKCGQEKDFKMFHKDKNSLDGFTKACKICRNNYYIKYYKENPEKQKTKNLKQKTNRKNYYSSNNGINSSRKAHLKKNFGISLEEYHKMLELQNNKCLICNNEELCTRNKFLSVDHNHETGKIRGLLCNTCNRGLGLFKDDIKLLKNAIKYLKNED